MCGHQWMTQTLIILINSEAFSIIHCVCPSVRRLVANASQYVLLLRNNSSTGNFIKYKTFVNIFVTFFSNEQSSLQNKELFVPFGRKRICMPVWEDHLRPNLAPSSKIKNVGRHVKLPLSGMSNLPLPTSYVYSPQEAAKKFFFQWPGH